jgi:mannose-1-phosphate guanylyltransferase / mannose-6-phosphate isomerase
MSIQVQPVVMAGGSGTRLWPLSRAGYPKQFLVLSGTTSLLQQAVQRMSGLADAAITVAAPLVVGNEEHRFLILDQLRELKTEPKAATPRQPSRWRPCKPWPTAATRCW